MEKIQQLGLDAGCQLWGMQQPEPALSVPSSPSFLHLRGPWGGAGVGDPEWPSGAHRGNTPLGFRTQELVRSRERPLASSVPVSLLSDAWPGAHSSPTGAWRD